MKTASEKATSKPGPRTGDGVLVDPQWLEAHLEDPRVRVVEVAVSPAAYNDWHIDGAVLWNVYADVKDAHYRLVDAPAVQRLVTRSGIRPDSTVVFYGYAPAMGFWLMKLYGHADVRILDCSRDTWQGEGRPCRSAPTEPAPTTYVLPPQNEELRVGHTGMRHAIGDPKATILDVRTLDEYRGERFWPSGSMEPGGRAGHIPSAVHQPIDDLYDDRGSFRAAADLRRVFRALDLDGDRELLTYCTIGGRASTAWFALTYLLGRDRVRVYDGSWAEWGRMTSTPVEGL
jgi:thiosulfate/3-mercaptopyruvate sulfurtransferase